MRVKVQTCAPLPEHKFLLPLAASQSIAALAERVHAALAGVSASRAALPAARDLFLEVDGFQLLDDSTAADVLEPSDVVLVRIKPGSSKISATTGAVPSAVTAPPPRSSQKRREPEPSRDTHEHARSRSPSRASRAKRRRTASPGKATAVAARRSGGDSSSSESSSASESDSSSSSESESASSSESESESESDSDSDSDSSSSSSSSSSSPSCHGVRPSASARPAPSAIPTFPPVPAALATPLTTPPFQGKPSTHERNLRRRRAKQMRKLAEAQAAEQARQQGQGKEAEKEKGKGKGKAQSIPSIMGGLEAVPVPEPLAVAASRHASAPAPATSTATDTGPAAAQNPTPALESAVGNASEPAPEPPREPASEPASKLASPAPRSLPPTPIRITEPTQPTRPARLIPPSERATLPNNVFVTSREFEFVTDNQRRKMDAADAAREAKVRAAQWKEAEREREKAARAAKVAQATAAATEAQTLAGTTTVPGLPVSLDGIDDSRVVPHVEAAYDSLARIGAEDVDRLREGAVVAWKDVVLDTATFSPQLKVLVGRVIGTDEAGVTVRLIPREDEEAYEEEEEEEGYEPEPSEVVLSRQDLAAKEYRLVTSA